MKIGIIGSNSFLGKNTSIYLQKENIVKNFSSYKRLKKKWLITVSKEIKNFAPDIIINCSASQLLEEDKKSIEKLIYSNLYSQTVFLSEAKKIKNFRGFITFGSRWEYDERGNYKPNSFYAATKHASDYLLQYFTDKKTTIVSLKIFDTYGKNDKRKKILNLLLESYKKQKTLNLSPGKQEIDYVHVIDICKLINQISNDIKNKKIRGFKRFTVSSKNPIKLINIIKILKKKLKNRLSVKIGALKYRKNEPMKCSRKIFNYPNWRPKKVLINELRKIFD
tara:strand:- start:3410 stop:4246 length:837 start_codon:yes stop_codon:yes gene_type:complete